MWQDNIRIDLRGREWIVVYWFHIAQDRDQWRAVVFPKDYQLVKVRVVGGEPCEL
jgi:hypothetical protein